VKGEVETTMGRRPEFQVTRKNQGAIKESVCLLVLLARSEAASHQDHSTLVSLHMLLLFVYPWFWHVDARDDLVPCFLFRPLTVSCLPYGHTRRGHAPQRTASRGHTGTNQTTMICTPNCTCAPPKSGFRHGTGQARYCHPMAIRHNDLETGYRIQEPMGGESNGRLWKLHTS
jgi:hypothetical protein